MNRAFLIFSVMAMGVTTLSFDAYARVALAQVRIKVVDQDGTVVPGARVWGGFTCGSRMNDYVLVDGQTDTNGVFVAHGNCNEFLRVDVTKDGYYQTEDKIFFWRTTADPKVKDGKWQPYDETRIVVLKRIQQPHDMIGTDRPPQRKIKIFDEWLGFDLGKGDFLPPVGDGRDADVLVRFRLSGKMPYDWSIGMDVSFTNYPYAGAYLLKKDGWSDMKSVYQADTNAHYLTELSFHYTREKGNRHPIVEKLDKDEYLVFRTRTKVDCEGRLVSARYGKLYGPWHFEDAGGSQIHKVFLNEVDNDVNLEDQWTIDESKKYRSN